MLLIIPLKTTQQFDLLSPFTTYLQNKYPHLFTSSQKETLRENILHLSSLRNCISSAFKISNDTISGGIGGGSHHGHSMALSNRALEDCMEYHACLLECERRGIVFSSSTTAEPLVLNWRSAFFQTKRKKDSDGDSSELLQMSRSGNLHFERVCLLFNIAALLSYQASSSFDRGTTSVADDNDNSPASSSSREGRTKAIQSYQSAAAVLHYLIQTMGYQGSSTKISRSINDEEGLHITPDMSEPSLSMLLNIMLAQGQALSYLHLSTSSSNPSLLSKLAQSTASFYNAALQQSQNVSFQRTLPHITTPWGCHLKICSLYYHAIVQYHASQQAITKDMQYGKEIARLEFCIEICGQGISFYDNTILHLTRKEAVKKSNILDLLPKSSYMYDQIQQLCNKAKERLSVAIKDNKEIYYDIVPPRRQLEDITGVDLMSKHLNIDENAEGGGRGLDKRLFPEQLERPVFLSLPKEE